MNAYKLNLEFKIQDLEKGITESRLELLKSINQKIVAFKRCSFNRDRKELIACILLLVLFGIYFFITPSILKKVGCLVIVLAALRISYKLCYVSMQLATKEKPGSYQSIRTYLFTELRKIMRLKKLLENIARWYIIPLSCGLFLITLGSESSLLFKINYLQVVAVLGGLIWYLHHYRVSYKLDPLIFEIKQSIRFEKYSNS